MYIAVSWKLLYLVVEQKYSLPGGWCDIFRSPSENAYLEVLQESGYKVEINRVLGIFDRNAHSQTKSSISEYCIYFSGTIIGGSARTSHETDEVSFFSKDDLPELSFKNSPHELDLIIDIYYNGKSIYFD